MRFMSNDGPVATALRYGGFYFAARALFEAWDSRWYHAGIKALAGLACIVLVALLTNESDDSHAP